MELLSAILEATAEEKILKHVDKLTYNKESKHNQFLLRFPIIKN